MIYQMPPPVKQHRNIPTLGHRFETELNCKCGTAWHEHQACPLPCQWEHILHPFAAGSLPSTCRRHQVTVDQIAERVGCSRETVRKAHRGFITIDADVRLAIYEAGVALLLERGVAWEPTVRGGDLPRRTNATRTPLTQTRPRSSMDSELLALASASLGDLWISSVGGAGSTT